MFFKEMSRNCLLCAEFILNEIDDINQLSAIFAEKPFGKDTLLDLMVLHQAKFRPLLKHPLIKVIAKDMWSGCLELTLGFSESSYVASGLDDQLQSYTAYTNKLELNADSYF
jgi:hypothetical protein